MPTLREELERITQSETDSSRQPELIEALRNAHSHGIRLENDPTVAHIPLKRYNCYAYALGIAESAIVKQISEIFVNTFVNGEFVQFLIENRILEEIPQTDWSRQWADYLFGRV